MPMNDMFKKYLLRPSANVNKKDADSGDTMNEEDPKAKAEDLQPPPMPANAVWLKYKEGYINAVRYPVKIRQLI